MISAVKDDAIEADAELSSRLRPADVSDVDDMQCYICGKRVYEIDVHSFSVYEWMPETGGGRSMFRGTFCTMHNPMNAVRQLWARTRKGE